MRRQILVTPDSNTSLSLSELAVRAHIEYDEDTCQVEVYNLQTRCLSVSLYQNETLMYQKSAAYAEQTHVVICDDEGYGLDPAQPVYVVLTARPAAPGPDYTRYGSLTRTQA